MAVSPDVALRLGPVCKARLVELSERLGTSQSETVRFLIRSATGDQQVQERITARVQIAFHANQAGGIEVVSPRGNNIGAKKKCHMPPKCEAARSGGSMKARRGQVANAKTSISPKATG